jgi:beta-N-acetylhexosaminidase
MNVASHILAGLEGTQISPLERDLILKHKVLGFTLFKRNIASPEAMVALNEELQALAKQAGYELILAVDQEGGRVARLPEPFSTIKPMREWASLFEKNSNIEDIHTLGKILGSEVKAAGFNLDFAPVVDLDTNSNNPIIGDRSFSAYPDVVYKLARHFIRGLMSEGVLPCLKHFPGHGHTEKDSHLELPVDNREAVDIETNDLIPYQKLIAEGLAPTLMTAHVMYPKIDKDNPGTLSKPILTDWLRKKLNYQGIIFSDDFLMKAIADNYDLFEASKQFIQCGGDVILVCDQPEVSVSLIEKLNHEIGNNKDLESSLKTAQGRIQKLQKFITKPSKISDYQKIAKTNQDLLSKIWQA